MDQNSENDVWINNSRTASMAYLNFDANFEFLGQFTIRSIDLFFKEVLIILR